MIESTRLLAEKFASLAHPNRIRILKALNNGALCNCELAPLLHLEQSNLSRHLKIMVDAGILTSWRDGLRIQYAVADERIFRVLEIVATLDWKGEQTGKRRHPTIWNYSDPT